jgi:hypothetical protein
MDSLSLLKRVVDTHCHDNFTKANVVHSFEPIMSYLMLPLDSKATSERAIDQA